MVCAADHLSPPSSTLWKPSLRSVTQSGSSLHTLEALLMAPTMVQHLYHGLFKHRLHQCSKTTCSTSVYLILRVSRSVALVHVSTYQQHTLQLTKLDAIECLNKIHSPALSQLWWTRALSLLDLFWKRKGQCKCDSLFGWSLHSNTCITGQLSHAIPTDQTQFLLMPSITVSYFVPICASLAAVAVFCL